MYLSCAPTAEVDEDCIEYWSIGVLDLSLGFEYPFPGQSAEIDLGFPRFSNLNGSKIVFDHIDWSEFDSNGEALSLVLTYDFENKVFTTIVDSNAAEETSYSYAKPAFIGDDYAITFQYQRDETSNIWQANIDESFELVSESPYTQVLPYDSGFATPHRNSYQRVEATLETDVASVNFGTVLLGNFQGRDNLLMR